MICLLMAITGADLRTLGTLSSTISPDDTAHVINFTIRFIGSCQRLGHSAAPLESEIKCWMTRVPQSRWSDRRPGSVSRDRGSECDYQIVGRESVRHEYRVERNMGRTGRSALYTRADHSGRVRSVTETADTTHDR